MDQIPNGNTCRDHGEQEQNRPGRTRGYVQTEKQAELDRLVMSPARHIMAFGGARSGKTFEFCRIISFLASVAGGRYAIVRHHFNEVRTAVFMDTLPKVFGLCWPKFAYQYNKTDTLIAIPQSGGEIWGLGLDDKERVDKVLGKEFTVMYFNECSAMSLQAVQTARTRVSQKNAFVRNKVFYDCNPTAKTHWTHRMFIEKVDPATLAPFAKPEIYASIQINPRDNAGNLPPEFLEELASLSPEKRARFLEGAWADDNEKALWRPVMIDAHRATVPADGLDGLLNTMERVVIGVDPAVTSGPNSDMTGIVVAGRREEAGGEVHYYVLGDHSMAGPPQAWAGEVCRRFHEYSADCVVVEVNNGGELVESVIRNEDPIVPCVRARASRGKILRAEPVSVLYSRGLVHHAGIFRELEEQMVSYTGEASETSPDRLDALVWAVTELAGARGGAEFGHYGIL